MLSFIVISLGVFLAQVQIGSILQVKPDLILLAVVFFGLMHGWARGVAAGVLMGFLQDVYSGGMLGISSAGLVLCGFMAGYASRMLWLRFWMVRVLLVFIMAILNMAVFFLISAFFLQINYEKLRYVPWIKSGAITMIIAAVIFYVMEKYEE